MTISKETKATIVMATVVVVGGIAALTIYDKWVKAMLIK
jgi:hypothetical protein